jgi:hypothetical protein
MPAPRPPRTFLTFKPALLAMPDADRAYLRAWVPKYVDENGRIAMRDAKPAASPAMSKGSSNEVRS